MIKIQRNYNTNRWTVVNEFGPISADYSTQREAREAYRRLNAENSLIEANSNQIAEKSNTP